MTSNKKTSEQKIPAANLSMKLYFRMVKYAIRYWKVFVFSILSLVVLSATNTGFLATIKMVTDEGFVKHDSTKLHVLPLMLFGLLALRAFSGFSATFAMRWVARRVVEDLRDVLAIENTGQFAGLYHVLGGIISPLSGISPGDLTIESLVARVASGKVSEVILGLSPTMEGDTTAFYLTKKLKEFPVKLSTIARGIPIGGDLEYTDEITLGRSIVGRVSYE